MESRYLELWGNTFLNAARGQKLMEDFSKLMEGDIWKIRDLSESMSRLFGFDLLMQNIPGYMQMYLKATEEFQKSIMNFFSFMEFIPAGDYRMLRREYDELKQRSDRQERELRRLQDDLNERLAFQGSGMSMLEEMMTKQTRQFQDLMTSFAKLFSAAKDTEGSQAAKSPERKKGGRSVRNE